MADPWGRFRFALVMLGVVMLAGTVGYILLGLRPFSALYQTAITITTVGYGEVGEQGEVDDAYRAFTLVLVLVGASGALYTISVLLETLVEGSLNDRLRRGRMQRYIDNLDGHVIVAGWGRVGHAIADYVARQGNEIVVIDREPAEDEADVPIVVGEATDDEVLEAAGLFRAKTLIAALSVDADNLYVTLTARAMRPDLFIVVRTSSQANEPKFHQAGANRVVNPHEIGGSRMGALALQPHVAEFLDEVLHDPSHDVNVIEVAIDDSSPTIGHPLEAVLHGMDRAPAILAIRTVSGEYESNPPSDHLIATGDVLIALGSKKSIAELRSRVTRTARTLLWRGVSYDD